MLVDGIEQKPPQPGESWSPRVIAAMRAVPRHVFVPELDLETAYCDAAQPIGLGQTISQPTVVALMAQALLLEPSHRVLEIGTGCGYNAAVLAKLAAHVYSIELHRELVAGASRQLERAGARNVELFVGDGYRGLPHQAPFDRVVVTAAPEEIPRALFAQLAEGGVLVLPVGQTGKVQRLLRVRKRDGNAFSEDLGGVMFVPMVVTSPA